MSKIKLSDESIKELCELKVEIKRLETRYNYLSVLAKKAFTTKFPGDSVNEKIEIDGFKIEYSKKPKKVYDANLIEKLPKKLVREIATIATAKVDKLLSSKKLTSKQVQDIFSAKKFDGYNERLYPKTVGEQIRKTLEGKKKNAKISIKNLR